MLGFFTSYSHKSGKIVVVVETKIVLETTTSLKWIYVCGVFPLGTVIVFNGAVACKNAINSFFSVQDILTLNVYEWVYS